MKYLMLTQTTLHTFSLDKVSSSIFISTQVLLFDTTYIWGYLHLVSENVWHMWTGHCCINSIFYPRLGSVCEMVLFISHMSGFLIIQDPLVCPRGWVKADKTPKYSVKHGRPLPCGRSLQCLLGNYGNNSAVRSEATGFGMTRSDWWAWDRRSCGGGSRPSGSRWSRQGSHVAIP